MTSDFAIGTMTDRRSDAQMLKEAGIGWVRELVPFPFADEFGGTISQDYAKSKAAIRAWLDGGFKVMGITPFLGFGGAGSWKSWSPKWMGDQAIDAFFENYAKVCNFVAGDLKGMISLWEVGNEWNSRAFSPLPLPRSCELVFHTAKGIKEADPSLLVGTNVGGINSSYYFLGRLFGDPRKRYLDYCGVDQYFGTWRGGGPETWEELIKEWTQITGSKLLINEWGYAAEGALMNADEMRQAWAPNDFYSCCKFGKWAHAWRGAHTPEVQAQYVREALKVFASHRDKLIGCFFYRWEDQAKCWCGKADCPAETRWGLVDQAGRPKPGYFAFQEAVRQYFA